MTRLQYEKESVSKWVRTQSSCALAAQTSVLQPVASCEKEGEQRSLRSGTVEKVVVAIRKRRCARCSSAHAATLTLTIRLHTRAQHTANTEQFRSTKSRGNFRHYLKVLVIFSARTRVYEKGTFLRRLLKGRTRKVPFTAMKRYHYRKRLSF